MKVPKLGMGGNNCTNLTLELLANKYGINWNTKKGV